MRNTLLHPFSHSWMVILHTWMVITCPEIQTTRQRWSRWATVQGRWFPVGIPALFDAQRCDNKTGLCEGSGFHIGFKLRGFYLKASLTSVAPSPPMQSLLCRRSIYHHDGHFGTMFFLWWWWWGHHWYSMDRHVLFRSILAKQLSLNQPDRGIWLWKLLVSSFNYGAKEMR